MHQTFAVAVDLRIAMLSEIISQDPKIVQFRVGSEDHTDTVPRVEPRGDDGPASTVSVVTVFEDSEDFRGPHEPSPHGARPAKPCRRGNMVLPPWESVS